MLTECWASREYANDKPMLTKPQSGVTLIEIIISLAIISVGLFTLLTVRNDNIKQADCANALSRAELLAAAKIDARISAES